ncbi:hypothetical protein HGRIS_012761 [Hohenbuehelia grisea]|uniref:PUL domain-containing protein n=1 Tax=Hohenbuehelia grisea TaxID=104357 RepID=A0ABR3ITL0_9AGAR
MALILRVLETESTDSEAVYRALVALGNMAHAAQKHEGSIPESELGEIKQCLQALPKTFPEERVRSVSQEISTLL